MPANPTSQCVLHLLLNIHVNTTVFYNTARKFNHSGTGNKQTETRDSHN